MKCILNNPQQKTSKESDQNKVNITVSTVSLNRTFTFYFPEPPLHITHILPTPIHSLAFMCLCVCIHSHSYTHTRYTSFVLVFGLLNYASFKKSATPD